MEIDKRNFQGDPNIGFYGIVTSGFAIIPEDMKGDFFSDKIVNTRVGGVRLIGLFSAGNVNSLIVPDILRRIEKKELEEKNINFQQIDTNYNALGNLILCNDNGAIISRNMKSQRNEIEKALDVPVHTGTIAGLDIPGSCGVATNHGALLHRDANEDEIELVERVLDVEVGTGSINFGSPYVKSGVLANDKGALIGDKTTGPETVRIQESLQIFE